jgi:hypothetical protein
MINQTYDTPDEGIDRMGDVYTTLTKINGGIRPRLTFDHFIDEVKDRTERSVRDWAKVDRLFNRNKWIRDGR